MKATLGLIALLIPATADAEVTPQAPQGISAIEVHAEAFGARAT